jgi:2'-5' RNA ligase superfamily protein
MADPDGIHGRAEQRFALLRRKARESVAAGVPAAAAPAGWCISTVARLVKQDKPLTNRVQEIQSRLSSVGELHLYPAESLHVSLLGCTQREELRQPAQGKRMDEIAQAFARATVGAGPVRVTLGGLNLVGPQLFIEVLTEEPGWKSLRERLAAELIRIGENPMTHTDPEPMHLNIARILRLTNAAELRRLLSDGRPTVDAALELATLELVVTDFVLTPALLAIAGTRHLDR